MAHKKAGGAKAKQGGNVKGKRLGPKVHDGGTVKPGQIIVRQRGRSISAGIGTMMGKDYTVFSVVTGIVRFRNYKKDRKIVDVTEQS